MNAPVMNVPALKCENISKQYAKGSLPVLSNFNVTVPQGKIVGLLGPNGCGKSTLMKLVSGLLVPDSGKIEICGIPQGEKTNALISYLPERPYFSPAMKVDELIDFFCDFYEDFDEIVARKMLSDLNINTGEKLRALSKGTKEKVQLILVMSRRARLYLLDEPIGGVDPAARDYILRTIIGNYNSDSSIIITTHLINDIEPVLDEFAFLGFGGKVLLGGDAEKAREESGKTLDELFREVFRCSQNF